MPAGPLFTEGSDKAPPLDDWATGHGFQPFGGIPTGNSSALSANTTPTDSASAKQVAARDYTGVTLDTGSKGPSLLSIAPPKPPTPLTGITPGGTFGPLPIPQNLQGPGGAQRAASPAPNTPNTQTGVAPRVQITPQQGGSAVVYGGRLTNINAPVSVDNPVVPAPQTYFPLAEAGDLVRGANPGSATQILKSIGYTDQQAQDFIRNNGVTNEVKTLAAGGNPDAARQILASQGVGAKTIQAVVTALQAGKTPASAASPATAPVGQTASPATATAAKTAAPVANAPQTATPDVETLIRSGRIAGAVDALAQNGVSRDQALQQIQDYIKSMTPYSRFTPGFTKPGLLDNGQGFQQSATQVPGLTTNANGANPQTLAQAAGAPPSAPPSTAPSAPAAPASQTTPPTAVPPNPPPAPPDASGTKTNTATAPPATPPPTAPPVSPPPFTPSFTPPPVPPGLTDQQTQDLASLSAQLATDPQMQYLLRQLDGIGAKTQAALAPILQKIAQQRTAATTREQAQEQAETQRLARTRLYGSPYGQSRLAQLGDNLNTRMAGFDTAEQNALNDQRAKDEIQRQQIQSQIQKLTEQQGARAQQAYLQLTEKQHTEQFSEWLKTQQLNDAERKQALNAWVATRSLTDKESQFASDLALRDIISQRQTAVSQGNLLARWSDIMGVQIGPDGKPVTGSNGQPIPTLGGEKQTFAEQQALRDAFIRINTNHNPETAKSLMDALVATDPAQRDAAFADAQKAYVAEGMRKDDASAVLEFYKKYPVQMASAAETFLKALRAGDTTAVQQASDLFNQFLQQPLFSQAALELKKSADQIAAQDARSQATLNETIRRDDALMQHWKNQDANSGIAAKGKVPQIVTATLVAESRDRKAAEDAYYHSPEYLNWVAQKNTWQNLPENYGKTYTVQPPPMDLKKFGFDPSTAQWAHNWLKANGLPDTSSVGSTTTPSTNGGTDNIKSDGEEQAVRETLGQLTSWDDVKAWVNERYPNPSQDMLRWVASYKASRGW